MSLPRKNIGLSWRKPFNQHGVVAVIWTPYVGDKTSSSKMGGVFSFLRCFLRFDLLKRQGIFRLFISKEITSSSSVNSAILTTLTDGGQEGLTMWRDIQERKSVKRCSSFFREIKAHFLLTCPN